jgi:hypothetical protein
LLLNACKAHLHHPHPAAHILELSGDSQSNAAATANKDASIIWVDICCGYDLRPAQSYAKAR